MHSKIHMIRGSFTACRILSTKQRTIKESNSTNTEFNCAHMCCSTVTLRQFIIFQCPHFELNNRREGKQNVREKRKIWNRIELETKAAQTAVRRAQWKENCRFVRAKTWRFWFWLPFKSDHRPNCLSLWANNISILSHIPMSKWFIRVHQFNVSQQMMMISRWLNWRLRWPMQMENKADDEDEIKPIECDIHAFGPKQNQFSRLDN